MLRPQELEDRDEGGLGEVALAPGLVFVQALDAVLLPFGTVARRGLAILVELEDQGLHGVIAEDEHHDDHASPADLLREDPSVLRVVQRRQLELLSGDLEHRAVATVVGPEDAQQVVDPPRHLLVLGDLLDHDVGLVVVAQLGDVDHLPGVAVHPVQALAEGDIDLSLRGDQAPTEATGRELHLLCGRNL